MKDVGMFVVVVCFIDVIKKKTVALHLQLFVCVYHFLLHFFSLSFLMCSAANNKQYR